MVGYGQHFQLLIAANILRGPNTNLGHNSIILMIEAQAMYISALIRKVRAAKEQGGSISIQPKSEVVKKFNNEIQARLAQSAFADPNCNSWYKNEAGLITNNWADAVIPYQKRTSSIDWEDFDIIGTGLGNIQKQGRTSWPRVVEETQLSNAMILSGLITAAGVVTAGTLFRDSLKTLMRH